MSQAATLEGAARGRLRLPAVSLASVLLGFAALQIAAYLNAGVFEYPLDDVYIHLAVAEQIAAGGYGVNPGEYASAASSPVYPLLLVPFAGSEAQRFLPLVWNIAALAACGWLWGRILVQAGYDTADRAFGVLLAVAVPLVLNLPGIAYIGMEHTLHTATSLAVILGLLVLVDENRVSPWLIAGVLLGPAMRFEALAISGLAALFLILRGHVRAGFLCGVGALAVAGLFTAFLVSLGLDPLPSSVQAKLGASASLSDRVAETFQTPLKRNTVLLIGALLAALLLLRQVPSNAARRALLPFIALALLAHLVAGKTGWMNRYENYILVASVSGLLACAAAATPIAKAQALLPVALAAAVYTPEFILKYPHATRTIDRQQAQMARFAQDFHVGPVAVNDIGRVAWGNRHYVLDLWGLGSLDALRYRRSGDTDRWAGLLAEQHGINLAMIYDAWLGAQIGENWVRLGQLELEGPSDYAHQSQVAFYAASSDVAPGLLAKIQEWQHGLPEGAYFVPEPEALR
ncbi:hypothetical protein [Tropicimonas aquimaris]|uniref:Glycosyltransferase RgtA/B/C/D-like domain-containing protein n=1 Tax=Tropicimonas aquimaris TaxID=914152 RepID=A0ABW3IPW1_9RHOB